MRKYAPLLAFTVIALTSLAMACNDISQTNKKFDRAQWKEEGDLRSYPNRNAMLNDLLTHHQIKGLSRQQILDSIGEPDNYGSSNDSLYYDIVTNYGYLDPKSGKYLSIGFSKDSIATGYKVVEWKNRHANE